MLLSRAAAVLLLLAAAAAAADEEEDDWYSDPQELLPSILPHLKAASRVLHVGCGTSALGVALVE